MPGGWSPAIEEMIQGERTGYQPRPVKTVYFEDVKEGDELPKLVMPITVTRCAYLASGTRDFSPQHHNHYYATERSKVKDMFLNTPFISGMVSRFLTDWTGPEGDLKKIRVTIKGSICAGDEMIITGKVTKKYLEAGQHRVDVDIMISTQDGPSTPCSGTVILPSKPVKKG